MRTSELTLPDGIVNALEEQGYVTLYPPQADAVPKVIEGRNVVVAVPTATGKSLVGYVAALRAVLIDRKKVLYIVPLKALASEKRDDLEKFSKLGLKVMMSTGDLDSEDRWMSNADIIVATSEKADSLLRHGSRWMEDVGLVIADEVHLIHDPSRGPTLEVALTKMIRRNPGMQIIALSATISNSRELSEWLNADLVTSDWRPIPLKEGVYFNGEITYDEYDVVDVDAGKDEIWSLIRGTIDEGGQCLVFVNARRSTESLAVKYSKDMGKITSPELSDDDIATLEGESESTALGKKLASCAKCGMAFHNAGLTYQQRRFVEDGFKAGRIKCIIATPTLAAGINLPARRVIVRDTKRFESNSGYTPISVMEVKQMCGRAGRPRYDPHGEAILIAKTEYDKRHLIRDYLSGDSEPIMSKLGNEAVLRSHILGLIATEDASSEEEVITFLRATFFGHQSELFGVENVVEKVVKHLIGEGMVSNDDGLRATPYGKRVSDLYIDPESAIILRDSLRKMNDDTPELAILHAVASVPDVLGLYPKKADGDILKDLVNEYDGYLLIEEPDDSEHYIYFLSDLKVAYLMLNWITEVDEDTITDVLGIGPGDIRARVDTVEWILHAMNELSAIFRPECARKLKPLLTRVRYGIKSELIDLVAFKGVGRSRARTLYNAGIKSRKDIADPDINKIAALPRIGMALAKSLKEQVGHSGGNDVTISDRDQGERTRSIETARDAPDSNRQSNLLDFRSQT
ncbi:MAG: DEAD/DEAH box helicase [Methanomassiliicoccaceae archaeon]|jgi:helicase|nr:DEAD/DEAH box helicase [Methanomassiliicoccaceae archaeon]